MSFTFTPSADLGPGFVLAPESLGAALVAVLCDRCDRRCGRDGLGGLVQSPFDRDSAVTARARALSVAAADGWRLGTPVLCPECVGKPRAGLLSYSAGCVRPLLGRFLLCDKRRTGFSSYAYEYRTLGAILAHWELAFGRWERDAHSALLTICPPVGGAL